MEGKLIKLELSEGYRLDDLNGNYIASTLDGQSKLSHKNCEAIANGYNLGGLIEEVREEFYQSKLNLLGENTNKVVLVKETAAFSVGFDRGFQKALEILGDKKFSEQDMYKMFIYGHSIDTAKKHLKELEDKPIDEFFNDFIQSLQPAEWDVEIEMEDVTIVYPDGENEIISQPRLDKDGCLILKRK